MKAIKYYGVFRGSATMPIAAFAIKGEAEDYASHRNASVKECYMDCGYRCSSCGGLTIAAPDALPCDNCELSDGCTVQPFTDECEEARRG